MQLLVIWSVPKIVRTHYVTLLVVSAWFPVMKTPAQSRAKQGRRGKNRRKRVKITTKSREQNQAILETAKKKKAVNKKCIS